VYYIYLDEAGTSAHEPATVVVGVVINADRHWKAASEFLENLKDEFVPKALRPGFTFHAKDIWAGYKEYRDIWPREQRAEFIGAVASIPRFLPSAIVLGLVWRRADESSPIEGVSVADYQHVFAFWRCVARANKYIRDWAAPSEVATLVAEDVPQKRRMLKKIAKVDPGDFELNSETILLTELEIAAGRILQTQPGPIDRIIDTVHFVTKDEAPLTQIADACAFVFRRYFAEQEFGAEWVYTMLGEDLVWSDWQGPFSERTFSFDPNHSYPTR
jgi:hypothetical protein